MTNDVGLQCGAVKSGRQRIEWRLPERQLWKQQGSGFNGDASGGVQTSRFDRGLHIQMAQHQLSEFGAAAFKVAAPDFSRFQPGDTLANRNREFLSVQQDT